MELWGMYGSGCVRRLFRGTSFSDIHGGWLAAGGERLLFMKTVARHLWAMKTWSLMSWQKPSATRTQSL